MPVVLVRLSKETLTSLDNIQRRLGISTKTAAFRSAIAIADMVTEAIESDANVIIHEKNGEKYILLI